MSQQQPYVIGDDFSSPPHELEVEFPTTFQLPFELRSKILKYLLISSSPIVFRHPSGRKGHHNIMSNLPFLQDRNLARQFTRLCLVSKQTRHEAQEIFFEQNQWVVDICVQKLHQFGQVASWMKPAEAMLEKWGEASIRGLRYLRLSLSAWDYDCRQEMRTQLEALVEKLKGGKLKRLEVYWCDFSPQIGGGSQSLRKRSVHKASERRSDGTRDKVTERFLRQWAVNEVDLEPLKALRYVAQAKITGAVTDDFAEWLENIIMTAKDDCTTVWRNTKGFDVET